MISIIIPTYNEAGNIAKLISVIRKELYGRKFEIIVVDDDSPDKTWKIVSNLIKKNNYSNVKLIRRINERGLSSAVLTGFKNSKGEIVGVIDADLSHPPELMNKMIDECSKNDIVIASRYVKKGREELSVFRKMVSYGATVMARPLTKVNDPMSGYFFFKKDIIKNSELKPYGYKILLEILVKGKYSKYKEIDFSFGKRYSGKSKLGAKVYIDYILHLISLYAYKIRNR
jgi:dolichol-phosphate mannosyltransferase